jgi:hypothetical protein
MDKTLEATGPSGASYTFSLTVKDVDDGGTFQCTDGPVAPFPFPAPGSISYTVTAGVGVTTISCSATDSNGNTSAPGKTFKLTVTDKTPPALTSVSSLTVNATSPSGPLAVSYTPPTATDLVDGIRPVMCTPAPNASFAQGSTTVTCSASDTHGNTGKTTFTVTVLSAAAQLSALKTTVNNAPELTASLKKTLQNDLTQAGSGTLATACVGLTKFSADVNANTPPITGADQTAWLNATAAIRPARGC